MLIRARAVIARGFLVALPILSCGRKEADEPGPEPLNADAGIHGAYAETTLPLEAYGPMALDGDYIDVGGRGLWRVPKGGGSAERVLDVQAETIAVDDLYVYWAGFTATDAGGAISIGRAAKADWRPEVIATPALHPKELAVDNERVYWIDEHEIPEFGGVYSVPKTGGEVVTHARGLKGGVSRLLLDGDDIIVAWDLILWGRIAKRGGAITEWRRETSLVAMARTDNALVWLDQASGRGVVRALSKVDGVETDAPYVGQPAGGLTAFGDSIFYSIVHRPPGAPGFSSSEIVEWNGGQDLPRSIVNAPIDAENPRAGQNVIVDTTRVYWMDVYDDRTGRKTVLRSAVR